MRAIRRILVAVKDSRQTSPAVSKAAQLAKAFGAELELFHGITTPVSAEVYALQRRALQYLERKSRAVRVGELEASAEALRREGLTVNVAAHWDYPASEAIVRRARRIGADLVVAEPHHGRRMAPVLLHVTDWELLRLAPMPVLLVKTPRPYRNPVLLAAVDPTHALAKPAQLDAEILRVGEKLAGALHGKLHALHCFVPSAVIPMSADAMSAELLHTLESDARNRSRTAFDRLLKSSKIPPRRRHLAGGHPAAAIPAAARDVGSAIVIMGAVSRSGLRRLFIGNTAERVLDAVPCDVLVVKPRRFVTRAQRSPRGMHLVTGSALPMPY